MDIHSLYYFSELAKDCHMTNTAKRLFISQQTLSNQIARLEEQLGCRLFYRKPALSLTYAGEQVLAFANSVLNEQANLQDLLADIQGEDRGLIRFGASAMRLNLCLPSVVPEFSKQFPNVEIRLASGVSRMLEPMIQNGSLDIAVIVSDDAKPDLTYLPMMRDQIFLCVPESLFSTIPAENREEIRISSLRGADLRNFQDLPFYLFDNHLGNTIQQCFDAAGIRPEIRLASPITQVVTRLGLQGKAAFFSTKMILSDYLKLIPENMNIFPLSLHEQPLYQNVYLIRHNKRYISHYLSAFMDLLSQYFAQVEQTKLSRTAI